MLTTILEFISSTLTILNENKLLFKAKINKILSFIVLLTLLFMVGVYDVLNDNKLARNIKSIKINRIIEMITKSPEEVVFLIILFLIIIGLITLYKRSINEGKKRAKMIELKKFEEFICDKNPNKKGP